MLRFASLVFLIALFDISIEVMTAQTFSDAELQCFVQHKVLHRDGKCYTLHQQGPCPTNKWLVYEQTENGTARPHTVCKTRPCSSAQKPIFWPEDRQCHKLSDSKTLCRYKHNLLKSDSYGDGECACKDKHARFETEVLNGRKTGGEFPWEGDCYPLFYRGPCPPGKILHPQVLEGFGLVARCADDYCAAQNNASTPDVSYVMRKQDRKCYRLDSAGPPCGANEFFAVHPMTHLPQCYGLVSNLFTDDTVRCGGVANINQKTGECRMAIALKAQTFGFQSTRRKRANRRGKR